MTYPATGDAGDGDDLRDGQPCCPQVGYLPPFGADLNCASVRTSQGAPTALTGLASWHVGPHGSTFTSRR